MDDDVFQTADAASIGILDLTAEQSRQGEEGSLKRPDSRGLTCASLALLT